jgi:hypothetical protein
MNCREGEGQEGRGRGGRERGREEGREGGRREGGRAGGREKNIDAHDERESVCEEQERRRRRKRNACVCVCVGGGGGMKTVKEMGPSLSLSDLVGSLKERTNEILKGEKKEIQRQGERKKDR